VSRFQQILRSLRFMFSPYRPLKRPAFYTDRDLLARQMAQRDLIGEREVKPVLGGKRLIEDQPDYGEYHGQIG
jgi:hypothetical protein